jgi:hypothetical protein
VSILGVESDLHSRHSILRGAFGAPLLPTQGACYDHCSSWLDMSRVLAWCGLLVSIVALAPAHATEVRLAKPGADVWRALEFPKIPRHTAYAVVDIDGSAAWRAFADCSASAMYLPATQIDLRRTPRLQWRWRVDTPLQERDPRAKSGDDFAARVYVMFRFDRDHASLWERAQHALGAAIYGDIVPGNAINYVWSRREAAGTTWENPFAGASKMESLGASALRQWSTETVDVAADYQRFFGHAPPALLAVAVMTDGDNSCQQAVAYYTGFRFLGP